MDELKLALKERSLTIGVLVYDGYELLDVYGPLEAIVCAGVSTGKTPLKLVYVSTTKAVARSNGDVEILSDHEISDPTLPALDVLFIPGGEGFATVLSNSLHMSYIADLCHACTRVMTVGTGSMILAEVVADLRATTNKTAMVRAKKKYPNVDWIVNERWVEHDKYFTASGASAAIDMTLVFLAEVLGAESALKGAKLAEIIENPEQSPDAFAHAADVEDRSPQQERIVRALQSDKGVLQVAVLIYENFELLDTFGPCQMLATANDILKACCGDKGIELTLVGEDATLKSSLGPTFRAKTFSQVDLKSFSMVLVPGGVGTFREFYNPSFKRTIKTLAENCDTVVTVCTGSALLASTGMLDGVKATTNKLLFDVTVLFRNQVDWVRQARWVQAGNMYTSSGVSAGTDLSLQVLKDLFSEELADEVALVTGYEWNKDPRNDPFVELIKPPTFFNRTFAQTQKMLISTLYAGGFAIGAKMKGISGLLLAGPLAKFLTSTIH